MKHYLDLIRISAKKHRKQNRMTRICIVLSVFLVTVIFGMADMEMRSQLIQAVRTDGNWHAAFAADEEQGALLGARPEVEAISRYGTLNYHLKDGYKIEGIETGVCGFDREFQDMIPDAEVSEGTFPENAKEIVINENIRDRLGVGIGDSIDMAVPQGDIRTYRITGIAKNTALTAQLDAFCVYVNVAGFQELYPEETGAAWEVLYYVRFRRFCNIQKTIGEISGQFGFSEKQVRQNAKVLMLMFQSEDPYMLELYLIAGILAVLVVIAGILMITASMNSSIARRTEFFGMMRCLGATRKQLIRFVRREALNWCRTAIPAGVAAGTAGIWILCGMLRSLSPGLFEGLPVFGISFPGVAAGIIVGFITVLLAARSPAKRAAKVSPLTAVSGNAGTVRMAGRAAYTRLFRVDTALGIHHASGSRKNFFLVTGSFAFRIILFLGFSTAIDFMHHAITPLRPASPDISVMKTEGELNQIPTRISEELKEMPGVKRTFGRSYAYLTLPEDGREIMLISYNAQQFQLMRNSLLEGNLEDVTAGEGVLSVFSEGNTFANGRSVVVSSGKEETEVLVTGVLESVPDMANESTATLICSESLFEKLTGMRGYTVLDIQLQRDATDVQIQGIRRMIGQTCGDDITFSDKRMRNQEVKGAYYSMAVFLYGFLAVIALIGSFNIINCIAMSVAARAREYGAMRAVGMSVRQLIRMIVGETVTYTVVGVVLGCLAGLPLNWYMFHSVVTSRWGDAWRIPGRELAVIMFIMLGSVCVAVAGPARQISYSRSLEYNAYRLHYRQ